MRPSNDCIFIQYGMPTGTSTLVAVSLWRIADCYSWRIGKGLANSRADWRWGGERDTDSGPGGAKRWKRRGRQKRGGKALVVESRNALGEAC
jgi:hypothetical protein